jgi:hypothetical protein
LHYILGEPGITHYPKREAVRSYAEAIIELAQSPFVARCDQWQKRCVSKPFHSFLSVGFYA